MDPLLPSLVAAALAILTVGLCMRRFRQPHVVGYLLAGVLLGPHGLAVFTDEPTVARLGEVGVVLLLFFVGMEVSLPRLVAGWRIALLGTLAQILASVGCVAALGAWLDWPVPRVVLVGFAISLSSTAVVVSMLRQWGRLDGETGRDVIGILLVQDVAIVPMLIVVSALAGDRPDTGTMALQAAGGVAIGWLLLRLARTGRVRLPLGGALRADHELQVFSAFLLCFGFATVTGMLGLSTALGAFVAGVVLSSARETDWVHRSLEPFRVLFVSLFFVSIGMLIDLDFLLEHRVLVGWLVLATLLTNTVINAVVLRLLQRPWRASLLAGALLSQVGEFSFVLAAAGRQAGALTGFGYQLILGVITITLALSPAWIGVMRALVDRAPARSLS